MKKILFAVALVGVVSLTGISPAAAQSGPSAAIVNVPFQFVVADRMLPAGNYRIEAQSDDWSVIRVTNLDSKGMVAFTPSRGGTVSSTFADPQVTFAKFHGQYFLQRVEVSGRARELAITPAGAERTLAKLNLLAGEPGTPAK